MNKALSLAALTFLVAGFAHNAQAASSEESSGEAVAPRDAASGMPTGKRQHKPMTITKEVDKATPAMAGEDVDGTDESSRGMVSPRDAASGMATGKRQHKPMGAPTGDQDGDGEAEGATKAQDHNSSRSNKTAN